MKYPLVSVIIPTYNREHTLIRALQSVKKQFYRPVEIILIDDASTDGTSLLLRGFDFWDLQCRIIVNEVNSGIGYSRNIGIKSASWEFIALLDSDDEWIDVNKLLLQVNFLTYNSDYGFVATWYEKLIEGLSPEVYRGFLNYDDFIKNALFYYQAQTSTWLFRSSLILKTWYFWLKRSEDFEYLLRLWSCTKCFCLSSISTRYFQSKDWDYAQKFFRSWLISFYIIFLYRYEYPYFFYAVLHRFFRVIFRVQFLKHYFTKKFN